MKLIYSVYMYYSRSRYRKRKRIAQEEVDGRGRYLPLYIMANRYM